METSVWSGILGISGGIFVRLVSHVLNTNGLYTESLLSVRPPGYKLDEQYVDVNTDHACSPWTRMVRKTCYMFR